MGSCQFKMPDEFLMKLSTLGKKTDEIIPRVLAAGGVVVLARVKSNLQAVIGKGSKYRLRSTGELVAALGMSGARVDRNGNYNIKIGFAEPRRGGESNAKIASVIENGKHGQPARPFMKPAKSATKDACIAAMEAALKKEIAAI